MYVYTIRKITPKIKKQTNSLSVLLIKTMTPVVQQGAVSHLRNVHHPPELLVPPVPVQNDVF